MASSSQCMTLPSSGHRRNRSIDEPFVDLLQISSASEMAAVSGNQISTRSLLFDSTSEAADHLLPPAQASPVHSSLIVARIPPPTKPLVEVCQIATSDGCLATGTCRACAEEQYLRHQFGTTMRFGTTPGRCQDSRKPAGNHPDTGLAGTSPLCLNYFRFADSNQLSSKGNMNKSGGFEKSSLSKTKPGRQSAKNNYVKNIALTDRFRSKNGRTKENRSTACCDSGQYDYDGEVCDVIAASSQRRNKCSGHRSLFDRLSETLASAVCCSVCRSTGNRKLPLRHVKTRNSVVLITAASDGPDQKTALMSGDGTKRAANSGCEDQCDVTQFPDTGNSCQQSVKTAALKSGNSVLQRRRRLQLLFITGLFFGLIVVVASLLAGVFLLWPLSADSLDDDDADRYRHHVQDVFMNRRVSNFGADTSFNRPTTGCSQGSGSTPSNFVQSTTPSVQYVNVASSHVKPETDSSGWAMFSGGSQNGSRYTIIDKATTFYGGQERCQKLGGYLVHINSLREQLFVEDFILQELERQQPSRQMTADDGIVGYWLGAKRARGSHDGTCMYDQWKWVDSYGRTLNTIAGMTAFIPGKPDNYYSPEECLFMSFKDRTDENRFLKWDDAPCDLNSVGGIKVICEVELR